MVIACNTFQTFLGTVGLLMKSSLCAGDCYGLVSQFYIVGANDNLRSLFFVW